MGNILLRFKLTGQKVTMAAESDSVFPENITKILMNFGEICRFCLSEAQNDVSIRDKCLPVGSCETEQDTIYNFVTKMKIIKMNSPENFPSLVCKNCYEIIKICYNFITVCQKSENLLKSCYERSVKECKENSNVFNSVITNLPYKTVEVIKVGTNSEAEKALGENSNSNSKTGEMKKGKIILISEEFSENSKCNDFTGFISLNLGNENCCSLCSMKFSSPEALNLHYICVHEKMPKELFIKQENPITCNKTAYNKQVSKQSKKGVNEVKNFVHPVAKAFCCSYCTPCKEFQTRKDLLDHMKNHKINDCFHCPYCEEIFSFKLGLKEHLISSHNLESDVSEEDIKFLKQEHTIIGMEHDKLIHSVTEFLTLYQEKSVNFKVCCKCCNPSVEFSTTNDFIRHITTHHSNGKLTENIEFEEKAQEEDNLKLKCSKCPAMYSQKQYLLGHMQEKHKKKHPKSMKCPVCFETFITNRKFIKHGIIAHQKYFASFHNIFNKIIQPSHEEVIQNKNFECDLCQKKYIFKTSLKKHIFSVHLGKLKGSVTCPHCGKTLANKFNLKSHIEFKHEALFVSCPICKKKINFRTIGRHYKVHLNASEACQKNSYLCTQCGKILKSKRSFEDHQKLHKNVRNELCDVCGGGYTTKKALRLHKKTHDGTQKKLHECDQCNKVFSGKHTLSRHLLTHSGVKNFICEICSKCFYTLQELKRHVRYHKKEYRFECQQCDMRFVDKSRFRHHLMKHKNIRPHKCQFCEKMFIVRGKMNLHMASKHNFQVDSQRVWKDPKAYIPLDELL